MHKGTTPALLSLLLASAAASAATPPAPAPDGRPGLPPSLQEELEQRFAAAYDEENAGWTRGEKSLDADAVELSLARARRGDETARDRARATLDAAANLIDPVSGGIAASSASANWRPPRPEKPLAAQAAALRTYALGFALWGFAQDEQAARGIVRYLDRSLAAPGGAFFAGAGPARRVEARDNGAAIEGLSVLADATGDADLLRRARKAARFVLSRRLAQGGGFRVGDGPGPATFEGTLAMGSGLLALYGATAEPEWLARAAEAAAALEGLAATGARENAALSRFANLLARWTGEERHRALAKRALRSAAGAPFGPAEPPRPGLLLAAEELSRPPLHVTVVGAPDDAAARALYAAARRLPDRYKRTDLWNPSAGPLRNTAVQFPPVKVAAAFLCSETSCSLPIARPDDLSRAADRLSRTAARTP